MIIWFTGFPDAGKTTIINELVRLLKGKDISYAVFDGEPIKRVGRDLIIAASIEDLQLEGAIVVHVNTPLYICALRNTRGQYDLSVPAVFVPDNPDLSLCTVCTQPEESARKVLEYYENTRL